MAKKIGLVVLFSILLTIGLWQVTSALRLSRTWEDIVFLASPLIAIAISILVVRKLRWKA